MKIDIPIQKGAIVQDIKKCKKAEEVLTKH
jgi:hypothetical protein